MELHLIYRIALLGHRPLIFDKKDIINFLITKLNMNKCYGNNGRLDFQTATSYINANMIIINQLFMPHTIAFSNNYHSNLYSFFQIIY
jgi:hypothetical protein